MDTFTLSHGKNSNGDVWPDVQQGPLAITHHRPGMPCYSRVSSGNIFPSRFVAFGVSAPLTDENIVNITDENGNPILTADVIVVARGMIQQATSNNAPIYGISQAELRGTPYRPVINQFDVYAALDGESLFIFGPPASDVLLMYGGQVQVGDRLTSDGQGRGITATSKDDWIGAIAQQRGNVGDVKQVTVIQSMRRKG